MNKKLKAPQVDRYLWWLGQMDYQKYDHASKYDARSYELLDELFELLKNIKTLEGSSAWKFWIRAERGTIEDYGDYEEMFDCGEVENHEDYLNRWKTEYPDETEWYEFQALDEKTIGYKAIFVRHKFVIVLDSRKPMVGYEYDISEFSQWLVDAVKEVISELKRVPTTSGCRVSFLMNSERGQFCGNTNGKSGRKSGRKSSGIFLRPTLLNSYPMQKKNCPTTLGCSLR